MEIDLERQTNNGLRILIEIEIDLVLKFIKRPIGVIITEVIKETGIGYGYTLYLNLKPL